MLKRKHQLTALIFGIFLFAGAILPVIAFAQDYLDSYFGIFSTHTHNAHEQFKADTGMSEQDFYDWADNHQTILQNHWSRTGATFIWADIEPVLGGGYDWDNSRDTDDIMKAFYASGQVNVVTCLGPLRNEDWRLLETELKDFISACVERYDGDGVDDADENVKVKIWQAFNEVLQWKGKGWSQSDYVTYMTWFEEAVHASDPDAKIMLIASQGGYPYMPFLRNTIDDLIEAGIPFDAVDIHNWAPYDDDGIPGFPMEEVEDCRAFLDSRGLCDVEIFTCENGTWFGCPIHPMGEPEPVQTEQEQARFLAQRIAYGPSVGLDHYLWNGLAEWYCFGGDPNSIYNSMGLVSNGRQNCEEWSRLNTEHVCYWTYKMLAEAIDKPANSFVGEMSLTVDNNRYGYEYEETATALHKYILWSWVGDQIVTFPINTSSAHVMNLITDRYGNILEEYDVYADVNGDITITINDNPVFIEELSNTSIEETGSITPNRFQLNQNYPNPFNPQTTISYQLPVNGDAAFKIYNMLGQEVRTLINENKPAGYHSIVWNGTDNSGRRVSSGVYFYKLELANGVSFTKNLLLLK